jgi:hypothetical protein
MSLIKSGVPAKPAFDAAIEIKNYSTKVQASKLLTLADFHA